MCVGFFMVYSEIVLVVVVFILVDMFKDVVLMVVGCFGSGWWLGWLFGLVSFGLFCYVYCLVVIIYDEDLVMLYF